MVEPFAGAFVTLEPICHRELAHPFHQIVDLLALLRAEHLAQDTPQQANVLNEGAVLIGSIVRHRDKRDFSVESDFKEWA